MDVFNVNVSLTGSNLGIPTAHCGGRGRTAVAAAALLPVRTPIHS
jgi:hypothetical protein